MSNPELNEYVKNMLLKEFVIGVALVILAIIYWSGRKNSPGYKKEKDYFTNFGWILFVAMIMVSVEHALLYMYKANHFYQLPLLQTVFIAFSVMKLLDDEKTRCSSMLCFVLSQLATSLIFFILDFGLVYMSSSSFSYDSVVIIVIDVIVSVVVCIGMAEKYFVKQHNMLQTKPLLLNVDG